MLKLFWNADSPYCRIVLWHIATSQFRDRVLLEHMSWAEIRSTPTDGQLGTAATVPCLELNNGRRMSDSLRILAHLLDESFMQWLLSEDGDQYRHIEGQLSRVMYGLYDRPAPEALKKIQTRWALVLDSSAAHLARKGHHEASQIAPMSTRALHIFMQFCLNFQPQWRDSIPNELEQTLLNIEQSEGFQWFESKIIEQEATVPTRLEPRVTES